MGWILRQPEDRTNPTLAGGVYGQYITAGLGVYWLFEAGRVKFILFISDGGRYGMDSITEFSYNGYILDPADWKFHPGTYTKQTEVLYGSTNAPSSIVTDRIAQVNGAPVQDGDPLKFFGQAIPEPLTDATVWAINCTGTVPGRNFQLSSTDPATVTTLIDITHIDHFLNSQFYVANAGFEDSDQGLPTFCPEVQTTFSGICYIEGKLPIQYNTNVEPTWENFRVVGWGRKLMNYDNSGAELGLISGSDQLLLNPALVAADIALVEAKLPTSRIDWPSLNDLKADAIIDIIQSQSTSIPGRGLSAKYYNFAPVSFPPTIPGDLTFVLEKKELGIYIPIGRGSPVQGVNPNNWCEIFEGRIIPRYSEVYTFTVDCWDAVRVYIDGDLIIDSWSAGLKNETGIHSLTFDVPISIKVEYAKQFGDDDPFSLPGLTHLNFYWQSTSQAIELVPVTVLYEADSITKKYGVNVACSSPTEIIETFDRCIQRAPGWDWTDIDGKITFLPPDRSIAFEFVYDAEDDAALDTILDKEFGITRRPSRDRRNWALYSYRNQKNYGFPEEFIDQDRPELRELGDGMPNNDPPFELMVMYTEQAQKIADRDFKVNSDPTSIINVGGQRSSGVATKNAYVIVKNIVKGDMTIVNSTCMVTSLTRQGNRLAFSLLPIELPLVTYDEA